MRSTTETAMISTGVFYSIIPTDNGEKIEISKAKVIQFWESQGFRKLKMPKGRYELVKIRNRSIICDAYEEELMEEIKKKLIVTDDKFNVWEEFLLNDFVNKKSSYALDKITELKLNNSTSSLVYFYFNNGILKVTPETMELISYEEYDGYVFENQIKEFNFSHLESNCSCDFDVFLKNVVNNDVLRYENLITSIGYIIHSFKDSTFTKALILVDENLDFSGEANGGTGKSIIGRAVSEMTTALVKDGKSLHKGGNRFFYQDINMSHRVLYIDDVNYDFNFEDFYSIVTGDLPVEEKYKASYKIPFELSPKLMISSNYMIKGSGGNSDARRRIEIEISNHYSQEFTPFEEFRKRLFDDWNATEWNCFYNTMASYCQKFMNTGIIFSPAINLTENKLKMQTDLSFVDFIDMNVVFTDETSIITRNKADLFNTFRSNYPVESKAVTNIKFKKWIDIWAKARGFEVEHRKSDGRSMIDIKKNTVE